MAVETKEKAKPALTEDFIGFGDISSSEDEEAVDVPTTGKRGRTDNDSENEADAAPGSYQKCYNGQPVPPWLAGQRRLGTGKSPDINTMINEEVTKFVSYISPTPEEHQMRSWVIERMQRILGAWTLPGTRAVAKCFGSFETRLYLPTSDIDMTIMLYNEHNDEVSPAYAGRESIRQFLYRLARQLKQNGFCHNCEVIANARVPIIKTTERISGIAVDISINADSGMKSAQVQKSFSEKVYPNALRAIVLAIKQFLFQRSMNEVYTGGMGSYAITLLVVSLLQMHPRIRSGGLDASKNLGVLLIEFFELYGKRFNYDTVCVSVRENGCYLNKRNKTFFSPTQPYLLAIEDPCDTSNDVTKGTYGISRIKQTFSGAYDLFNNAIFAYHQTRKYGQPINDALNVGAPNSEPAKKRARGKSGKAQAPSTKAVSNDPWAPVSFLSSILHIDAKTVSMRQRLITTFHKGTMQEALGVEYQPQLVNALNSNGTVPSDSVVNAVSSALEDHKKGNGATAQEQINRMKFDFAGSGNTLTIPVETTGNEGNPVFISDDEDDDDVLDVYGEDDDDEDGQYYEDYSDDDDLHIVY
ncbi:hypothetical protein EV176_002421 [Coemansia sp. RSA 451]|nr:hypothetical protein EV176_002421 [Coemansia sp. RSA 451]